MKRVADFALGKCHTQLSIYIYVCICVCACFYCGGAEGHSCSVKHSCAYRLGLCVSEQGQEVFQFM